MSELLYGRHAVLEALRADRRQVYRLWVEGDANQQTGGIVGEILAAAKRSNLPVRYLQGGMFDKFRNEQTNAQGVALETGDYPYVEWEDCLALAKQRQEQPLLLILDHLQDPQNLGTLIRTAEAMGVHGILMPDRRAARITPAVSNASAGAVEHLRVAQVTNLNRAIDDLKQNNIWVAGLDGDPTVPPANEVRLDGALAHRRRQRGRRVEQADARAVRFPAAAADARPGREPERRRGGQHRAVSGGAGAIRRITLRACRLLTAHRDP